MPVIKSIVLVHAGIYIIHKTTGNNTRPSSELTDEKLSTHCRVRAGSLNTNPSK